MQDYPENIEGVIATLEPAAEAGWISHEELERQKYLLAAGKRGRTLRGGRLQTLYRAIPGRPETYGRPTASRSCRTGEKGVAIMNAKKETAYMFADELLALHDYLPWMQISPIFANLEPRGLPKVREDAARISDGDEGPGSGPELLGALDEYGANGEALGQTDRGTVPHDFALIVGVPHAIPRAIYRGNRMLLGHQRSAAG